MLLRGLINKKKGSSLEAKCPSPGRGGGGTPVYGLYGDVPLYKVHGFCPLCPKEGIQFRASLS